MMYPRLNASWQFLFTYLLMVQAEGDECRTIELQSEIESRALQGHVFKSVNVQKKTACLAQCFQEANCVSYNVGPVTNDGFRLCELSDSDHNFHSNDLVSRPEFTYHPTENACALSACPANFLCQNGFTDKKYRCIELPSVLFIRVRVFEGGTGVVLVCNATGQFNPKITWNKTDGSLPTSRTIISEGNLTIRNVTIDDSGSYVCTATNSIGSDKSVVQLRTHFRLVTVYVNQMLDLRCPVSSGLQSAAFWLHNGTDSLPDGIYSNTSGSLIIQAVKLHHVGKLICVAQNSSLYDMNVFDFRVKFPETCSRVRSNISDVSGDYVIDPDGDGGEAPFTVYCDMTDKGGVGVTTVSHNTETRTHVTGYEGAGSYSRDVEYFGCSISQLQGLTNVSLYCEQFISYECKHSFLGNFLRGWWVSSKGDRMDYWGGATKSGNCACGETNSCATTGKTCNCDKNDYVWRKDSGLLTNKTDLPVSQLRFGDTGSSYEEGYHLLGKLKCYGL